MVGPAQRSRPAATRTNSTSRPGATRPWTLLQVAVLLAVLGLLAIGIRWALTTWRRPILAELPSLAEPITSITTAALPIGIALWTLAIVLLIAAALRAYTARRRDRLLSILAAVLGATTPLRLHVRWRGSRPRRGRIRYVPGAVTIDPSQQVASQLTSSYGQHYRATWTSHKEAIDFTLTPATQTGPEDALTPDVDRLTTLARKVIGPTAKVTASKADDAGRVTSFTLRYPPHPGVSFGAFRDKVDAALTSPLPGDWQTDWNLTSDELTARRIPELTFNVPYQLTPIDPADRLFIPIAQPRGREGVVGWDPDGGSPHGLVTGATGGGKTSAFVAITVELLRRGIPVWGLDPKMVELMSLEGWPGFERLATTPAEMVNLIEQAHELMMTRYRLIRARKIKRADLWPLVILLDEMLIMTSELNDYWLEYKAQYKEEHKVTLPGSTHPALRLVMRMAALARSARIHLVVGVQRPQATLFPEGSRDNFTFRLSLGRLSLEGAGQMWGDSSAGAAISQTIAQGRPGRGVIWTPEGPTEAQVFRLPELDLTTPDDTLDPADADLRRRLLAECEDARLHRPPDPLLQINDDDQDTSEAPAATPAYVTTPIAAKALNDNDVILIEEDDNPDQLREVAIEEVTTDDEDDRVLIDYRDTAGATGQLDLDALDEVQLQVIA